MQSANSEETHPIVYAVLAATPSSDWRTTVRHLYQHESESDACALQYRAGGHEAMSVRVQPALAMERGLDAWCVLSPERRILSTFSTEAEASQAAEQSGGAVLSAPIRRAMPIQRGIPQAPPPRLASQGEPAGARRGFRTDAS